jgi:hypothetical protein
MANPYPMQQPPMGMRPSMQPMQPQMQPQMPPRRGAPKAVPIIVSAGLAVGVFCGLLFGLGTGEEAKADTAPKEKKFVGTEIKDDKTGEHPTVEAGNPAAPPKSVTDGSKVTGTMKEPKASPSPSPVTTTGSAGAAPVTTGSAATVAPTVKATKVTIVIKPDTIKDAKITVDGAEAKDGVLEVPLGDKEKKEVAIVIKAPGFKDFDKKMEVEGVEMKIEAELTKSHSSSNVNAPKRPELPGGKGSGTKKGGGGTKKGGGGLIDI